MKTSAGILIPVIFLILFISACNQKKQTLRQDSFLGEWYRIKGDFEAYSFMKDSSSYIFVGTQDMYPVVYGRWKIVKDKFTITTDNGITSKYSFTLLNDTLTFNNGKEIYTRTAPLEVKYPEVRILKTLAGDFSSMNFSAPQPADLNWRNRADSTRSLESIVLKGYSISGVTTHPAEVVNEISSYLKEYGFEPDTVYVTETCTGFRDNNQLVTICTSQNLKPENDSIIIQITSGMLIK